MKHLLSLSLLGVVSLSLSAQSTLSSSSNLPRQGDRIIKQQVAYNDPGQSGTEVMWDFSEQKAINENYELKYTALNTSSDTLIGTEHRTMYYYHSRGDSLFSLGYENPTTLINFREPELLLVFPMPYGRSFTGYFDGKGNYCNRLAIHIQGKSTVTADAIGMMIIPGGDTLRHVLRVHTLKKMVERMTPLLQSDTLISDSTAFVLNRDSIDFHLSTDSIHMEMENWRWYAKGCRYPVFETIKSSIYKQTMPHEHFTTSFYYPPHEQYYNLAHDSENQEKQDSTNEKENRNWKIANKSSNNTSRNKDINYSCYINDESIIQLNYSLLINAEVTITLYDLQGRKYPFNSKVVQTKGEYQHLIPLANYSKGEYLLQIIVNGQVYGEKLMNR